jgi:hypothetical protein
MEVAMRSSTRGLLFAAMLVAAPSSAFCCDGPGGQTVAVSCDSMKCTATNTGRIPLALTFQAWGKTYALSLFPGQSGTPATSGWLNVPMKGYQSCTAVPLPSR